MDDSNTLSSSQSMPEAANAVSHAPTVHTFNIRPTGGLNVVAEGNKEFCHAHEVRAYIAWAKARIAELENAHQTPKWKPICSALRDGTEVLISGLSLTNIRYVAIARYCESGPYGEGWYGDEEQETGPFLNVTHWEYAPRTTELDER